MTQIYVDDCKHCDGTGCEPEHTGLACYECDGMGPPDILADLTAAELRWIVDRLRGGWYGEQPTTLDRMTKIAERFELAAKARR